MAVFAIWLRDVDLSYKLVSLWDRRSGAERECERLQSRNYEVRYFVEVLEVQSEEIFGD